MISETMKKIRPAPGRLPSPSLLLALGALCAFAGDADAQVSFAAEGRAGVTFPRGDLSEGGADAGTTLGAEVLATFRPNLTAYVGFQRHAFECDDGCTFDDNPKSTGVGVGLKYIVHDPGDVLVWGRAGIDANTLSIGGTSSDREIGIELGAGADLRIVPRLHVVPRFGFISHGAGNGLTASFFTVGLGAHYHIGDL